ncbi:MAG: YggS family pyridoxal phosphate-dependent enzyme [Phycisphaerae bacterium]|nr:YggS family pyridoxal phosphate-dependent enzyme [Phycisphaerae bacterium]
MAATRKKIEKNLERIRSEISDACARTGRSPQEVSIVAVTKTVELDTIKNLIDAGLTEFGENRVQQLVTRAGELDDYLRRRRNPLPTPVKWHMIGHLQRNKIRKCIEIASVVHSVDSLRLAEELSEFAVKIGKQIDIMLQVNCSVEPQKYGCAVGAALHMGELVTTLPNINLVGLMTMGPLGVDPVETRNAFTRLQELFDEMRHDKIGGANFCELSMGMTNDYIIAVEQGATIVRIGSALFE